MKVAANGVEQPNLRIQESSKGAAVQSGNRVKMLLVNAERQP